MVIEQAKGVTSERAGADLAEAFSRLRRNAGKHNLNPTTSPGPPSTAPSTRARGLDTPPGAILTALRHPHAAGHAAMSACRVTFAWLRGDL